MLTRNTAPRRRSSSLRRTSSASYASVRRPPPFVVSPTQKEKRALTFFYFFVPPKFYRKMEKPVSLFATAASHYEMSNQLFFVLDYVGLLISPYFAAAEALSAISRVLCEINHRKHRHRLRRPLRSLLWVAHSAVRVGDGGVCSVPSIITFRV